MATASNTVGSYAEGVALILQDIGRTLAAPDADVKTLMGIQSALVMGMKQKAQQPPRGAAGTPGAPGMGGPGGAGAMGGGGPGGPPPGAAPTPAPGMSLPGGPAGGAPVNAQQPSLAAPGSAPSPGLAAGIDPDEIRRMLQTQ